MNWALMNYRLFHIAYIPNSYMFHLLLITHKSIKKRKVKELSNFLHILFNSHEHDYSKKLEKRIMLNSQSWKGLIASSYLCYIFLKFRNGFGDDLEVILRNFWIDQGVKKYEFNSSNLLSSAMIVHERLKVFGTL